MSEKSVKSRILENYLSKKETIDTKPKTQSQHPCLRDKNEIAFVMLTEGLRDLNQGIQGATYLDYIPGQWTGMIGEQQGNGHGINPEEHPHLEITANEKGDIQITTKNCDPDAYKKYAYKGQNIETAIHQVLHFFEDHKKIDVKQLKNKLKEIENFLDYGSDALEQDWKAPQ